MQNMMHCKSTKLSQRANTNLLLSMKAVIGRKWAYAVGCHSLAPIVGDLIFDISYKTCVRPDTKAENTTWPVSVDTPGAAAM